MNITVNGRPRVVEESVTIEQIAPRRGGVAVAVNGAVVTSGAWATTVLDENDVVEIVTAHQGG